MSEGTDEADDRMDAELRKLLSGDALESRFREPSAEERATHAKDRRKQQKAALKRQRKDRRRRLLRRTAWGLAAIVLVGGGTFAYLRFGHSPGGPDDTRTIAHGSVPTGLKTTAPRTDSGPPADPFGGTPADKWANGAAGITIPAAKPIGRYSAAQVEDAYETTKKLLAAAALDPRTLNGGAPTAFARLLTQQQRNQFLADLGKTVLDKHGLPVSSRAEVTSFAPGTTKLIGSVIKVHGTMTAHASTDDHGQPVLAVIINYRIAYPVEPPKDPRDWMRVVSSFTGPVQFGDWSEAESPFEPWWNPTSGNAGARCGMKDGFIHPDYPNGPADTTPEKGPLVHPYALNDGPSPDACAQTTGT